MSEPQTEPVEEPQEPVVAPVPEPEPEPTPEPPEEPQGPEGPAEAPEGQPETLALLEERGKSFDKLSKHVAKRTGEILGEDATMAIECPLCSYYGMPGWVPTVAPPEELQSALLHYAGLRAPSDYSKDAYSSTCSKCNGLGEVLTGSQVMGQERLPCYDCQGKGWLAVGPERQAAFGARPNGALASTPQPSAADQAMSPSPVAEPPEVARLRADGYLVVAPMAAG